MWLPSVFRGKSAVASLAASKTANKQGIVNYQHFAAEGKELKTETNAETLVWTAQPLY